MSIPLATRALDPDPDWAFFHDAAPVAAEDRSAIVALDDASARRVWDAVVAQAIPATVVARDGWLCELTDGFRWQDAWNDRDDGWAARELAARIGWGDDDEVLFVTRPRRALRTRFGVFLRAWRAFLLDDDEGPLLVSLTKPQVAWFHPSGNGLTGRRPGVAG
ncbi:MAG: DUF2947 family protein [Phycisphaerae bacterium]